MRSAARLSLFVACAAVLASARSNNHHHLSRSCSTGANRQVIAQLFQWSWDSIAAECTNFLGPAGYGYVQTSPPQESVAGDAWWVDYQAVSYTINNKHGNRDQFANMVSACHNAGVKVIVDTIFNHMTAATGNAQGTAGTSYSQFVYDGTYQAQDFHYCNLEPGNAIKNWNSAAEVQTCQLEGLADLDTGSEYVRSRLAQHANDLLSLGVDGIRIDAAKHISVTDLSNILSRVNGKPYITQEVVFGAGQPIQPSQYVGLGNVQEFRYTSALQDAFSNSNGNSISKLQNLDSMGWISGTDANVFIANQDTERNGGSLNYKAPSNTYTLATIFMLAHPYGTPTVLSSYSFSSTDAGGPNGGYGTCDGNSGWLCQHRQNAVKGMVAFHNAAGLSGLNNWVSPNANQIAFGRGSVAFVAINNLDNQWSATFTTSLPDGSYCDAVAEGKSNGACSGTTYKVSGGKFTATVAARNAVAIYAASS